MNTTRFHLSFAALLASSLLVACGGGGSDSASVTNPTVPTNPANPTTPTDPVPSFPVVPAGTEVTYAVGSVALMGLEAVNDAITHCGYPRMKSVVDFTASAQAHAQYTTQNSTLAYGHEESATLPGFTGVTIYDRIRAAGGSHERAQYSSEVIGSLGGTAGRLTTDLLAAPLHLADLLRQWSEIGVGTGATALNPIGDSSLLVLNYGGTEQNTVEKNAVRTFPCDQSTKIPSRGGPESPDPLPHLDGKFGPGLNFETNKLGAITVSSITLRNEATGTLIPLEQIKTGSLDGAVWRSMWVSNGYLEQKASYRVEARGNTYPTPSLNDTPTPWTRSYSFQTM